MKLYSAIAAGVLLVATQMSVYADPDDKGNDNDRGQPGPLGEPGTPFIR